MIKGLIPLIKQSWALWEGVGGGEMSDQAMKTLKSATDNKIAKTVGVDKLLGCDLGFRV